MINPPNKTEAVKIAGEIAALANNAATQIATLLTLTADPG